MEKSKQMDLNDTPELMSLPIDDLSKSVVQPYLRGEEFICNVQNPKSISMDQYSLAKLVKVPIKAGLEFLF